MLNIITPASRFENLKQISKSIPQNGDINWIIVIDSEKPVALDLVVNGYKLTIIYGHYNKSNWGHFQRNLGIDVVNEGYIHFLDDDNILHPNLFNIYRNYKNQELIVSGNQMLKNNRLRFRSQPPQIAKVDIASCIIHYSFLKEIRLNYHYQADGEFIINLYRQLQRKYKLINEPISYYNYLR